MVWRLDLTGDVIPAGMGNLEQAWAHFSVDNDGMLTFNYDNLEAIVGKLVRAVNMLSQQVNTLQLDLDEMHGSVEHLEKQLATDMASAQDAQSAVRQMQVQLMTMESTIRPPSAAAEVPGTAESGSAGSDMDIHPALVLDKVDELAKELENVADMHEDFSKTLAERMEACEDQMQTFQGTIATDFKTRLTYNETMLLQLRTDIEKLGQQVAEDEKNKASSASLDALSARFEAMRRERQKDRSMLEGATEKFEKLDELYETVTRNSTRLQELWKNVKGESQEFRTWTCRALDDIRTAMRTKVDEHKADEIYDAMRRELLEFSPKIAATVSMRLEADMQSKANMADVLRLQEIVEALAAEPAHKGRLLMGTKCLTCDRPVSTYDSTDTGHVDLEAAKQQEGILKDVQRAIQRQQDAQQGSLSDVLNYVAVRVGSPGGKARGSGVYEQRVKGEDGGAGEYSITRILKPSRRSASPDTNARNVGVEVSVSPNRRSPREMPPMVRVGPRRIKRLMPPGSNKSVMKELPPSPQAETMPAEYEHNDEILDRGTQNAASFGAGQPPEDLHQGGFASQHEEVDRNSAAVSYMSAASQGAS
mmetsp:Transcript_46769/g.111230  ORF Transcript_46769/g.111230 Transcript_46769/m.111230 type:complete len:591 (-) Transcript_46769:32-1804(-)